MRSTHLFAIITIALVLSIPFSISHALAASNDDIDNPFDGPGADGDLTVFEGGIIERAEQLAKNDSSTKQCLEKADTSKMVTEVLDNEILSTLESIASIIYAICSTANGISTILTTIGNIIGFVFCCRLGPEAEGACAGMQTIYEEVVRILFIPQLQYFCFWVSGGICKSDLIGDSSSGPSDASTSSSDLDTTNTGGTYTTDGPDEIGYPREGLPEITGLASSDGDNGDSGGGGFDFGNYIGGASTYESIVLAAACLDVIAILYNLRKYKMINQIHTCCVSQACANGLSTEACDNWYYETMCSTFVGGIARIAIRAILNMVTNWIADLIMEKVAIPAAFPSCFLSIYEATQLPSQWNSVTSSWEWMSQTFSEPECSDLGFGEIDTSAESLMDPQDFTELEISMVYKKSDPLAEKGYYLYRVSPDGEYQTYSKARGWEKTTPQDFESEAFEQVGIKGYIPERHSGDTSGSLLPKDSEGSINWFGGPAIADDEEVTTNSEGNPVTGSDFTGSSKAYNEPGIFSIENMKEGWTKCLSEEATRKMVHKTASMASTLMGNALADSLTENMCSQEWNSSFISDSGQHTSNPRDNRPSDVTDPCEGINDVSYGCSCDRRKDGNRYEHSVEYTIKNCRNNTISYELTINKNNSGLEETLKSEDLEYGETRFTSLSSSRLNRYDECIVKVDGLDPVTSPCD